MQEVKAAAPEAIVRELTAILDNLDIRHFDRAFEITNRLRTGGLDKLIAAGREVGCRLPRKRDNRSQLTFTLSRLRISTLQLRQAEGSGQASRWLADEARWTSR